MTTRHTPAIRWEELERSIFTELRKQNEAFVAIEDALGELPDTLFELPEEDVLALAEPQPAEAIALPRGRVIAA